MRLAAVALAIMALTPLNAAAAGKSFHDYGQQILTAPSSGDELAFRTVFQHDAQDRSNALFNALAKVLGGNAPNLNFVGGITGGGTEADLSATPSANRINIDPAAVLGLINDSDPLHSSTVNQIPHEMAHLRQTPAVLASVPDREGGAQAFADTVTNVAASQAHIPYVPSNYDGSYGPYVDQAKQRGMAWIMGGQFGKPPVTWP